MVAENNEGSGHNNEVNGLSNTSPGKDSLEINNQPIVANPATLTTLNNYPLLSQIQKIDQQLMANVAAQTPQSWQPEVTTFNPPSVAVGAGQPFQPGNIDEMAMDSPYEQTSREYYMNGGNKDLEDTQQMMNDLNLEKQDFFDHKSEFTGDEA